MCPEGGEGRNKEKSIPLERPREKPSGGCVGNRSRDYVMSYNHIKNLNTQKRDATQRGSFERITNF